MISFLTLVSHYMGMISVKSKLKNQVYTALAFLGNWYLLYIGIRFIQNGRYLRGWLILAVFLLLLYFAVMNIFYYFTDKKPPFDISPFLEKYIGGTPEEVQEREELKRRLSKVERQNRSAVGSYGVFSDEMILPAELKSTPMQQANVAKIAHQMKEQGLLLEDYDGKTDAELNTALNEHVEVYALGEQGISIPFAEIKMVDGQPTVLAGLNQINKLPIGVISQVGLTSYQQALQENELYLASVVLNGGEKKAKGRSGLRTEPARYFVKVAMAFKKRN